MKQTVCETLNHGYECFDGYYATVIGTCRSGTFFQLDNSENAFAYKSASLLPGSKVLCTVLRRAFEDRKKLVSIDAIVRYAPLFA